MPSTMTGACNCGAVTYTVESESVLTYVCHCGNCQKRSGSAFGMGMFIPVDELSVEGDLTCWERVSDTGRTNPRYSCATCGNVIYGIGDYTPGFAKLMPGTLTDTRDIRPDVHIWVGSAQGWVTVPEDTLQYDEQPTDIEELLRLVAANRARASDKAT